MQKYFDYSLVTSLDEISLDHHLDNPIVVDCLNPHSFMQAVDDIDFHKALKQCDRLLPDGEGICLTLRVFKGMKIRKIAGDDLHNYLLGLMDRAGGRVFYLGSSEAVLGSIRERLKREHPSITVGTLSPSFCDELDDEESASITKTIKAFVPDVLFVSMTAPKQEKWVWKNLPQLGGVKVIASIGAVFDFYAGTVKRASGWAVRMRVEWLVRLLKEPRRMWRRTFVSAPRFLSWVWQHRKTM